MAGSVSLGRRERKRLLELYRGGGESSVRLRATLCCYWLSAMRGR